MSELPVSSLRCLHPLTVEEIEQVAEGFKGDLSRECERRVRRGDSTGALAAIVGKEYVEKFVSALKLRAGSELGRPKIPKKRIRPIYIPKIVKDARPPETPEETAQRRHVQEIVSATRYRGTPKHY